MSRAIGFDSGHGSGSPLARASTSPAFFLFWRSCSCADCAMNDLAVSSRPSKHSLPRMSKKPSGFGVPGRPAGASALRPASSALASSPRHAVGGSSERLLNGASEMFAVAFAVAVALPTPRGTDQTRRSSTASGEASAARADEGAQRRAGQRRPRRALRLQRAGGGRRTAAAALVRPPRRGRRRRRRAPGEIVVLLRERVQQLPQPEGAVAVDFMERAAEPLSGSVDVVGAQPHVGRRRDRRVAQHPAQLGMRHARLTRRRIEEDCARRLARGGGGQHFARVQHHRVVFSPRSLPNGELTEKPAAPAAAGRRAEQKIARRSPAVVMNRCQNTTVATP